MTTMTVRIPDELDEELRAAAAAENLSINSFLLEALKDRVEMHRRTQVLDVARGIIASDAAILDRLASS